MNADQLLATYLHTTTAALGTAMTSTSQLEAYGRALMPGFFRGVFPQGEEPADRRGAYGYIVNTQPSHIATGHWMGVYRVPHRRPLLFDTFARAPSDGWQPHLQGAELTHRDVDQDVRSVLCGQITVAWLLIAWLHGREVARAV